MMIKGSLQVSIRTVIPSYDLFLYFICRLHTLAGCMQIVCIPSWALAL